jgi:hypothetical protein
MYIPIIVIPFMLADASGAPLNSPANKELKEQNASYPFPSESNAEAQFLLLCCEESLHLFSTSAVIQVICFSFSLTFSVN